MADPFTIQFQSRDRPQIEALAVRMGGVLGRPVPLVDAVRRAVALAQSASDEDIRKGTL